MAGGGVTIVIRAIAVSLISSPHFHFTLRADNSSDSTGKNWSALAR